MVATYIYSLLNYGASYKTIQNYSLGQNLVSKSAQLVHDLERINATSEHPLLDVNTNLNFAEEKLDELIAGSIKEIIELRKSLGITTPAGQNKPLDALFKSVKGSVFNQTY